MVRGNPGTRVDGLGAEVEAVGEEAKAIEDFLHFVQPRQVVFKVGRQARPGAGFVLDRAEDHLVVVEAVGVVDDGLPLVAGGLHVVFGRLQAIGGAGHVEEREIQARPQLVGVVAREARTEADVGLDAAILGTGLVFDRAIRSLEGGFSGVCVPLQALGNLNRGELGAERTREVVLDVFGDAVEAGQIARFDFDVGVEQSAGVALGPPAEDAGRGEVGGGDEREVVGTLRNGVQHIRRCVGAESVFELAFPGAGVAVRVVAEATEEEVPEPVAFVFELVPVHVFGLEERPGSADVSKSLVGEWRADFEAL